jgi:hypothetical protein
VNSVFWKATPTALYVSWVEVGYPVLQTDRRNSFQVVITNGEDPVVPDGNNVSFCYKQLQWANTANPDGGGEGVLAATVGINAGDGVYAVQLGRFDEETQGWHGRWAPSGMAWLQGRRLDFNTATADIPPYFSTTECDTIEVLVGATADYEIVAHRGGPAPPLTVSSLCPTLSSYSYSQQEIEGARVITASMTPTADEVDVHAMQFLAANGIMPPSLTTRYVKVLGSVGIPETARVPSVTIYPNPASGHTRIQWPGPAPLELCLMAADGSVVQYIRPSGSGVQLDIPGKVPGLYTVQLRYPQTVITKRLAVVAN